MTRSSETSLLAIAMYLSMICLPYLPERNCVACPSKNRNKSLGIVEKVYYKNYLKNLILPLHFQELVVSAKELCGDLVISVSF